MADEPRNLEPPHEYVRRLRSIGDQPLAERAEAYAALHDELARRLESDPLPPSA